MLFKRSNAHFALAGDSCAASLILALATPTHLGLFEYKNFRRLLEQTGFHIDRVEHWQCAPRGMILPRAFRRVPILSGRFIARALPRLVEKSYRIARAYPSFCYWLWTFDCSNHKRPSVDLYRDTA
jgi:hypothetical protein